MFGEFGVFDCLVMMGLELWVIVRCGNMGLVGVIKLGLVDVSVYSHIE